MAGDRPDDELARTATVPGPASEGGDAGARDVDPAALGSGSSLGRYRIERAIGEGGMGVVHAAFDPDLERRVALKVLRSLEGTGDEARQRLLREARAMARLTHPNVVTVHEVGTASGRDYVAMELVDGESLAEWLRAQPRSRHDIVQAFLAAGRGLAAAHAAELVHRDFKPHNVLRRRDGRICVTDFGLARGLDATGLEVTVRLGKGAKSENTPSALSGLTATGAVLGTPAYMAPEQWTGGTVGPAADQFAFCVALWEALTGERPFRGATVELLKAEVARGPAALDASKIPRRLRAALRRGLDPDPNKRWPNIDALLAAIARAQRPPLAVFALGAAVPIAAIAFLALHGSGASGPACEPASADVDQVWSAEAGNALAAAGRMELRLVLDRDVAAWKAARERMCGASGDPQRAARLACLDGVLARFDAVHHAIEHVTGDLAPDAVLPLLVDPTVCSAKAPPRLSLPSNDDTVGALALALRDERQDKSVKPGEAAAFAARAGLDACAKALALYVQLDVEDDVPKERVIAADTVTAAEACGDDRLLADVLVAAAPLDYERPLIGPKGRAAIEKAAAAVERVPQADLRADVDQLRAHALAQDRRYDEAFAAAERAIADYGARGRVRAQIDAIETENSVRFARASVEDLKAAIASVRKWKPIASAHHFDKWVRSLEMTEAYSMLFLGDIMGAHAAIIQDYRPKPHADVPTQHVDGMVVDEAGKPMAGAIVAVGSDVWVDSVGPLPFGNGGGGGTNMRFATTDRDGKFAIADAPMHGGAIAQLQLQRGLAELAPHMTIKLAATRRIAGKVALGGVPRTKVFVMLVPTGGFERTHRYLAPLLPDGSFELLAVPTGPAAIATATWGIGLASDVAFTKLPAGGDIPDLQLKAAQTGGRSLTVIARSSLSAPLDAAQVLLLDGRHAFTKGSQLFRHHDETNGNIQTQFARPIGGATVPEEAAGKVKDGDLMARFDGVHDGEITACVIGINGDVNDPVMWRKVTAHGDELELRCQTAGPDDKVLVVEAPPQKRFD